MQRTRAPQAPSWLGLPRPRAARRSAARRAPGRGLGRSNAGGAQLVL